MKKIFLTSAVTSLLLAAAAVSGSTAEKCTDLLTNTCTGCHSKSNFCDKLGQPQEWNEILKRMIGNGATLSDDERQELADCLSKPSPEAEAVCKK